MQNTSLEFPVPAHVRPALAGISPQMRDAIARVASLEWPQPLPETNDGWAKVTNPDPNATRARIAALLSSLKLKMDELTLGGVPCFRIEPSAEHDSQGPVLVHFHAGGFVLGAGKAGVQEAILIAEATRYTVISVDYRLAPDHPYPAPIDDAMNAWLAAVDEFADRKVAASGISAGASIALSLTQRLIAQNRPLPAAIVAGSPMADLTETGDSYFTNRYADPMTYHGLLDVMAAQYAAGIEFDDPRVSPLYGPFSGFPPALVLSGSRDLFLSNAIRVDRKIRDASGSSEIIVYEGQSHGQNIMGYDVPETQTTLRDIDRFLSRYLV